MAKLILLRHGQSVWNQLNFFTGWVDVPLSSLGIEEALQAGREIRHIPIDCIFTSSLCRAQMTAFLAMSVHDSKKVPVLIHGNDDKLKEWGQIYGEHAKSESIPVFQAWQLNERMYGELQGLDKDETRRQYGAEQVQIWRRSYDVAPPGGESLAMTAERSIPYFRETILPLLQKGQNIFVSAHGNSLRSIVMWIDGLTKEEVLQLEIATGAALIYDYQEGRFSKLNPSKKL